MFNKSLNLIFALLFSMLLTACGEDPCKRECDDKGEHCQRECSGVSCIEGDDWGYPKIWVPAGTDDLKELNLSVEGSYPYQSAEPVDSGQVLLGEGQPILFTVGKYDEWTSWLSGSINLDTEGNPDPYSPGAGLRPKGIECEYVITKSSPLGVTASKGVEVSSLTDDVAPAVIWQEYNDESLLYYLATNGKEYEVGTNSPDLGGQVTHYSNNKTSCYLRYGMGLYIGLAADDGLGGTTYDDIVLTYHVPDAKKPAVPNDPDIDISGNAPGTTAALGDSAENYAYNAYQYSNWEARGMDGYVFKGITSNEIPSARGYDRIFFKILDNYYDDNDGGYTVKMKEGTRDPDAGPLETVVNAVKAPVIIIMEKLYKGLVQNEGFINAVRGALALYIVFYGFQFMIGMGSPEEIRKDAVIRILKIAIIIQLIAPDSWQFFSKNLFNAFLYGVEDIAGLVMSPFTDYDPEQPWYAMDALIDKFFSGETNAKIWALLLSNFPTGLLAVIVFYLSFAIFLPAILKTAVTYLIAFISMAILVSAMPIFIVFMLYSKTKNLAEEWLSQMFAIAIQVIILFAGLGMFGAVIAHFMERLLGFTTCWNVFWDLDFFSSAALHVFDLRFWMPDISNEMANLWMDANGDGIREINEFDYRYVDLPYLDPVYDKDVIASYMTEKNFLSLGDILIFFGSIYLMYNFMKFVPTLSDALRSGGQRESTSGIFGAAKTMMGSATSVVSSAFEAGTKTAVGIRSGEVKQGLGRAKRIAGIAGGAIGRKVVSGGSSVANTRLGNKMNLSDKGKAIKDKSEQAKLSAKSGLKAGASSAKEKISNKANKFGNKVTDNYFADKKEYELEKSKFKDIGSKEMFSTDVGGSVLDVADKATNQAIKNKRAGIDPNKVTPHIPKADGNKISPKGVMGDGSAGGAAGSGFGTGAKANRPDVGAGTQQGGGVSQKLEKAAAKKAKADAKLEERRNQKGVKLKKPRDDVKGKGLRDLIKEAQGNGGVARDDVADKSFESRMDRQAGIEKDRVKAEHSRAVARKRAEEEAKKLGKDFDGSNLSEGSSDKDGDNS